jgi:hypothetical protein
MKTKPIPILVMKAPAGGWIIKQHEPRTYKTRLLFAGDAQECVHFIARYMAGTIQENTDD